MKLKDILLENKKKLRVSKIKYKSLLSDGIKRKDRVKYIYYEGKFPYARFSLDVMENVKETLEKIFKKNNIHDVSLTYDVSSSSVSTYLEIFFEGENEDYEFKLRFSDHDDRYGSDYTVRLDKDYYLEYDEEYNILYVDFSFMEELIKEGVDVVVDWFEKIMNEE